MSEKENILFAPLNWGLGHATRCVPLINDFLKRGCNVIIAADGSSMQFLKLEFPDLEFIILPDFKIRYGASSIFLLYLFLQMPFFYLSFWIEHLRLKRIIKKHNITTVISDNRYGLWSKKVKSILITHQLFIQLPKLFKSIEPILHFITRKLIKRFDECWVPDYKKIEKSLSGKLSHGLQVPKNIKYIGPLSRFSSFITQITEQVKRDIPDVLIIISGPEPHRTYFELEMENRFANTQQKVLIVCGKPQLLLIDVNVLTMGITKIEHLNTNELHFYLTHTKQIIARSGYSTIMDLHVLGISAELIPTPGQTEQEYLAEWHAR